MRKHFAGFLTAVLLIVFSSIVHANTKVMTGGVEIICPDIDGYQTVSDPSSPMFIEKKKDIPDGDVLLSLYSPTAKNFGDKINNTVLDTYMTISIPSVAMPYTLTTQVFKDAVDVPKEKDISWLKSKENVVISGRSPTGEVTIDTDYAYSFMRIGMQKMHLISGKSYEQAAIISLSHVLIHGKYLFVFTHNLYMQPEDIERHKALTRDLVQKLYDANK